jgi:hypothetical protein
MMRFMVMVKPTKDSEAGKMPSEELLSAMAKFNEEMVKAGVMLDANGLQPSSKGARIRFSGDKRTVIDGPFAETKELVAGYWILQVKSKEEAIEWIKRCPNPHEGERDRDPPSLRTGGLRRQRGRGAPPQAGRADREEVTAHASAPTCLDSRSVPPRCSPALTSALAPVWLDSADAATSISCSIRSRVNFGSPQRKGITA